MGSKSVALLISLNLLFFSMVSSNTLALAPAHVSSSKKCPELRICTNILLPPNKPDPGCCPLIAGLIDLEAAVCLCTVLKLNISGIISIPLDILVNLQLKTCGRKPTKYNCK